MDLGFLQLLASPWFVLAWYGVGAISTMWVLWDLYRVNTATPPAMKWSWPIIVFFFSAFGLLLYLRTFRPRGVDDMQDGEEKQKAYDEHVQPTFRRVTGSVIHCVGGDGLGIMTAMVIARLLGFSFWEEYWFEYLVGFAFGWFIFQRKAMMKMTDSQLMALWMGGRAEFFSMLSVMAGMGLVMGYVTPLVVGEQPKPFTFGFWGFSMLGLLLGFFLTFPMNWGLVKIGWKHGK